MLPWSEFGPYVHPHVIGCPEPVLIHHARLATIEFCRKTSCWMPWLDEMRTSVGSLELDVDAHAKVSKVKTVNVNDEAASLVEGAEGIALAREDYSGSIFCYSLDDNKTLNIYPEQPTGTTVAVRASLRPSRTATGMDDAIGDYMDDIAPGVIASIMRVPAQAFTNLPQSAIHEGQFRERIKTIAAKVGRGNLAAKLTRRSKFF